MLLVIVITFFVTILIGIPIGYCLGIVGLAAVLELNITDLLMILPQKIYGGVDRYAMMAIPFFLMAGEIMNKSGITSRVVDFCNNAVGHLRGGLAHVNILASIIFAGNTGAAVSDTAALGTMLIPAMEKEGYSRGYSAAVTVASSVIGPIIPPSIIAVIYGCVMNVSIAGLFAAGIVPGFLFGVLLMVTNSYISKKKNYPLKKRATLPEVFHSFVKSIPALLMPLIIIGGIVFGIFTPTESAAIAVGYAIILGLFIFKSLKIIDIWQIAKKVVVTSGVAFLLIAMGGVLSWVLASEQIPQMVALELSSRITNVYLMLIVINAFLMFVGMFMDINAALIVLAPVLAPLAIKLGVSPLHFGIIMIINLNIALITPPVGGCLFVVCSVANIKMEKVVKDVFPFIITEMIALALITYFPFISLTVPSLLGYS